MSTTTDTTDAAPRDPYIRGTDETVLLDLRELRAQEAADKAAREAAALGTAAPEALSAPGPSNTPGATGAELERYHGSHRREAVLYADGGTAIPLDRVREVCHDLRQPVAAILMLASAAELRPDVPERVRDVLQEIMSQTEEISATVRQFLDDAKQGVDGLGEPVPCNVAGLTAQAVERWRATFDGDLALAAAEDPLHVTVDPVLFKRALGNVLSNGTRAAGESGRVRVTVRRFETAEGERAVIEVDDSGPGFGNIPAGHGLGLAVVRRTIEAAGGAVEFADGPMGGALVRLVLPVTPIRPLSAEDELTRTFHGEISLSQLAAELAAGNAGGFGVHPALAEFDDDDFDDDDIDGFDDFDDFDEVDEADDVDVVHEPAAPVAPAGSGHTLAGGHAFMTRISAWPEPLAIGGAPEQLAIGGDAGAVNPFGARSAGAAEPFGIQLAGTAEPFGARRPGAAEPFGNQLAGTAEPFGTQSAATAEHVETQIAGAADNRSYFGLPPRELASPRTPEPSASDRGFFGVAENKGPAAEQGYFGLPLKSDNAAPAPVPRRRYGAPAEIAPAAPQQRSDISAHPVPAGVLAAHRAAASRAPQSPAETRPAGRPQDRTMSSAAIANTAHLAGAQTANSQASAAAPAPAQLASADAQPASPSAQPAAQSAAQPAAQPVAQPAPQSPATTPGAAVGQPHAGPQPAAAPVSPPAPAQSPVPGPAYDPTDTQPLHIIPTGQDDTALASIQLPSQANLTHPPRIPASALRPVAEVQLSLLPGGAF